MRKKHKSKGLRATKCFAGLLAMATLLSHAAFADTVYRCGETYSSSNQCAGEAAKEVKPNAVLHSNEPDKANTAARDLRDAQALEKQRLQAEQQAAQAVPIRLSAPSAAPSTSNVPLNEPSANKDKSRENGKGKRARKPNNPYFTAVDPTAAPKKKSTAKAVPASTNP
jgi:hypothetical protein